MTNRSSLLSFNLGIVPGVTAMFDVPDLRERLDTASSFGFSGVEGPVPASPSEMRQLLDERDMQFVCLSFARGRMEQGELGVACALGRRREFRDELRKVLDAAQSLGCRMVHPLAGRVASEARAQAREVYLENLRFACDEAGRVGVNIVVEPICAARQPDFFLNTQAQALQILQAVDAPNLRIMADMFHAGMSGELTSELARLHPETIGLLQVSSTTRRRQPDVDDPELLATLAALAGHGWRGWVSGEYVPEGDTDRSLAWTRLLRKYGVGRP